MAKQSIPRAPEDFDVERIKRLVVTAMFSDDELMNHLVLKGGNALDLVHKISSRASVDIDFSMENDFPGGIDAFRERITGALSTTFADEGYAVFDLRMEERPDHVSAELKDFWGGYNVSFKLIGSQFYSAYKNDLEVLRRNALNLGIGTKFLIDISRYEFVEGKQRSVFDGYVIFVYTVPMMICEKLRAICQQMPDYGPVVNRNRAGSPRARDFVDIYALAKVAGLDVADPAFRELLRNIFAAKRVPLHLLKGVVAQRDFHRADFPAVAATVRAGVVLEEFDFYFDYVLSVIKELESLGEV